MRKTLWGMLSLFVCAGTMASPPTETTHAAPLEEPVGELTLQDALTAARGYSPKLAPVSWELRAREAEALGAGRWTNPELGVELENFGGGGELDGTETTVTLSQLIELGGKRGKRRAVAAHEHALAGWDYEVARLDVLTETTHRFLDVLGAQEQLRLALELVEVSEEIQAAVSRRVRAGATSSVEASRARIETEMLRIERANAERALNGARTRLAATWGGKPQFSAVTGALEDIAAPPTLEEVTARTERNPSLARWSTEEAHRQATLDLARAERIPDVSIGAGVRRLESTDDTAFLFEFGVPLPFFDRNQGATTAASLRHRRSEAERHTARTRIDAELGVAHETLMSVHAEIEALRDRAIPDAAEAFAAAQTAYLRGAMRLTDVLDIERLLFELRARHVEALVRYHRAVAVYERLIGGPLDEIRRSQ